MRIASCLVALVLLLLVSLPAPSLAGEASFFAVESPSCPGEAPLSSISTEQGVQALPAAIGLPPRPQCGACSTWDCRGITLYTQCANGKPYSGLVCVDIGICTADGSPKCDCRMAQ